MFTPLFLLALASCASAVGPFPAKDYLNCRTEPNTSARVVKTYAKDAKITISCATHAEQVNGYDVWDKTSDGCYVSDYYVATGQSVPVAADCSGQGPYPAKDYLNCRTEPKTSASIVKTNPKGAGLKFTCALHAEKVNGYDIWDKTTDGCYVSDFYVETGSLNLVAPDCNAKTTYPTKDVLNCRTEPKTSAKVVKTYPKGAQLTITCAMHAEKVNGYDIWDKTSDGCFVSDFYVETGSSDLIAPQCPDVPPPVDPGPGPGTPGGCKDVNDAGVNLIKSFEGCVPNPYQDPKGLWTVGYGHLCANGGQDSTCGDTGFSYPLTEATATELFKRDLQKYVDCMPQYLNGGAKLNKNQWAALTSFCYNLGCGVLADFADRLNNGEDANTVIGDVFPHYTYSYGEQLPGLVRRRNEEVALAQTPGSSEAWPNCAP